MKKIFAIVFMIIMMFCQVCVAFEQPDPTRWTEVARDTTGTLICWIDTKTLRFEEKYGETYANLWVMYHKTGEEAYSMQNTEINISKREFLVLSITSYDDAGNVSSFPSPQIVSRGITPGSMAEGIYDFVSRVYNVKKSSAKN